MLEMGFWNALLIRGDCPNGMGKSYIIEGRIFMEKRKPNFLQAISCILFLFISILVGNGFFHISIQPLLLLSAAYAAVMGLYLGYTWKDLEKGISSKLEMSMPTLFIIMTVGIVVGTWIFSGTVPMMLYYGLKLINPSMFLITAFFIVALIAIATGTTWGAAATAGVALMGVAAEMQIPAGIAAGAIIAGAVVGDKMSPLSDTTNLCPLVCEISVFQHIGHVAFTVIPSSIIALIIYFIAGRNFGAGGAAVGGGVSTLITNLEGLYHFNIFLLLPIVIIVVGSMLKKPTVPLMLISSVVAVALGVIFHGMSVTDGFNSMMSGFQVKMFQAAGAEAAFLSPEITTLVTRGGISSMMTVVITIFCGYSFAGIIEKIGCLDVILGVFSHMVKKPSQLILVTIVCSTMLVFTAGVASISILMTGLLLKDAYRDMGIHTKNLSRTLEDAGTMFLPFVPWGTSALFYIEILGVGPGEYWMWTIPCYLCVVFAIIYAVTGFTIVKKDYGELNKVLKTEA